jgi:hypothetical protein
MLRANLFVLPREVQLHNEMRVGTMQKYGVLNNGLNWPQKFGCEILHFFGDMKINSYYLY